MTPRLSTVVLSLGSAFVLFLLLREGIESAPVLEQPLVVQRDQGELRLWRALPGGVRKLSSFTIKIDRQNGGSPDFWFISSAMPPGAAIRLHRHLHEDEVLFIDSGTARIHLGDQESIAYPGAIVFIPRNTWVSVKNIGNVTIALRAGFNAPGFDRFMRCESVPLGQHAAPLTAQEDLRCQKLGDVEYR